LGDEILNSQNSIYSFLFFTPKLTIVLIIVTTPCSFDRNTMLGWMALSSGVATSDVVLKLMAAPLSLPAGNYLLDLIE